MSDDVKNALTTNGCTTALWADYMVPGAKGNGDPVMVSLEIIPFGSSATAQRVADILWGFMRSGTWNLGLYYPQSGPGASLCTGGRKNSAMDNAALQHRYVLAAQVLYTDGTTMNDNWTYGPVGTVENGCARTTTSAPGSCRGRVDDGGAVCRQDLAMGMQASSSIPSGSRKNMALPGEG